MLSADAVLPVKLSRVSAVHVTPVSQTAGDVLERNTSAFGESNGSSVNASLFQQSAQWVGNNSYHLYTTVSGWK